MTVRVLIGALLVGSLSMLGWAQGTCGTYWFVSGYGGNGSQPDYSYIQSAVTDSEAQYGGIGPFYYAQWEGVYGVWGAWNASAKSIPSPCNYTPPSGGCSSCTTAGQPIDLGTGNTYIQQTDVQLPGLGGGLMLKRTWSSLPAGASGGMFGPGWLSNVEEQIYPDSDGTMKYLRSDGSVWSFAYVGNPPAYVLVSPTNGQAVLTEIIQANTPTGWMITFQNGEQRYFALNPAWNRQSKSPQTNGGKLNSITDRNGHATTLAYDTTNQGGVLTETNVLSVTDSAGHTLYFTYNDSSQVASVTSNPGTGINVRYSYSPTPGGYPALTRITQSDNTFVTYSYDAFGNITSVNDMNDKVIESHTYDLLRRGLSSSHANGVGALTVTYP